MLSVIVIRILSLIFIWRKCSRSYYELILSIISGTSARESAFANIREYISSSGWVRSGTITVTQPASEALRTPFGESSSAMHPPAGSPSCSAA